MSGIGADPNLNLDEVTARVEDHLIVSAFRCADCDELHPDSEVTSRGETFRPEDFGIHSEEEWRETMDREEEWLFDPAHRDAVMFALGRLEREWPITVMAIINARIPSEDEQRGGEP